ncbi:TetR family transcriptional regulator [Gordonia amarae]|uniref:TetR family transcriptional regulator n=2 Tax=Gordonia amarae TaxID=36821 RepID=A0A857MK13_9ACTN|nr:TetR/AcrR family transcriptional regulator [Gordonia amarae]MCS3876573.1 AcrR family transcriptional regulator [Gordonia amarae]QHN19468.1 TetR family transcriptional regulator [Gordonia amarae]QHN23944.1 TetR family transcriptional regulator [Gordonia amarae]QHN32852.1 TetR family transcriptional regulator [Gordonia amarae]QHN41571.1 TetR family transcriptional regulator [Gordonia amarae]
MSTSHPTPGTRRRLTGKRADTVRRLGTATVEALRESRYGDLTVQDVARRAGVTRATAYIYFSSKEHLIAEEYLRRLSEVTIDLPEDGLEDRVIATLRGLALAVGDEPDFGRAASRALQSDDPEVDELRLQLYTEIRDRLTEATGPDTDPGLIDLLELIYTGAIVRAGTGHVSYESVADTIAEAARRVL